MENSTPENSQSTLKQEKRVFQMAQKNFAILGIHPNLRAQPYHLNGRIRLGIFILGANIVCNLKYTFYEAKTVKELMQSVYFGSVVGLIAFILLIILVNVKKLFEHIEDCEDVANTSKENIK